LIAVNIVAVKAAKLAMIHVALHKVVPLHPVLVGSEVCKLVEVCYSRFEFFKLPILRETLSGKKAYGPVVVLSLDWVGQRSPLAVALDANVIPPNRIQCCRIHDVVLSRVSNVLATRSMTLFAADVPLRHGFGLDVVVYRVASIARRAGGAIEIGRTIIRYPPVSACFDVIREPHLLRDVPLRRERKIILAPLGEIPLLVATPVYEGDILQ